MKILITGGTGTLGKALASRLSMSDNEIHVLSRDENKQKAMQRDNPLFQFHVGDICCSQDLSRIEARNKFDTVYHCAASKHIEICEQNVSKCVQVNYEGVKKVYEHFCENKKTGFVFFSTDKAVKPINAYGHAKALAEKYLKEQNEFFNNSYIFRWGNILGSTGSVLPIFMKQLAETGIVNITSSEMTRFWLTIDHAAEFVVDCIDMHQPDTYIPLMKASKVLLLVDALAKEMGIDHYWTEETGIRKGEKIHEDMTMITSSDIAEHYDIDEMRRLVRPFTR